MSGPTTAIFVADPITVLVSAAAIRATQAIVEGYANANALRDEQQDKRELMQSELKTASAKGRAALQQEMKAAAAEFDQLVSLAKRYAADDKIAATRPALPDTHDEMQLAAYVRSIQALIKELHSILLTESALRMDDLGPAATLDSAIAQAAEAHSKTAVQRLLARIAAGNQQCRLIHPRRVYAAMNVHSVQHVLIAYWETSVRIALADLYPDLSGRLRTGKATTI